MPITLSIQAYEVLAAKHGKEEAKVLIEAFETVIESVLSEARLKNKLELRQDLTQELVTRELFEERMSLIDERMSRMATKEDLANLRAELKQDITDLRVEIKGEKADIIKWVAAILVAQAAANAALVKLL